MADRVSSSERHRVFFEFGDALIGRLELLLKDDDEIEKLCGADPPF
jgi:hypothetical protein